MTNMKRIKEFLKSFKPGDLSNSSTILTSNRWLIDEIFKNHETSSTCLIRSLRNYQIIYIIIEKIIF